VGSFAPWLPLLLALAAGGWALRGWYAGQRAREALVAFAVSNGWDYRPVDPALVNRWFLPPFGRGEQRQVHHVISGRRGSREFVAFEYRYVDVTRDSKGREQRRRRRFFVVSMRLPGWLPTVSASPESWRDRAVRPVSDDIELESEDFNRHYVVRGSARTASDLLTPRAMDALVKVEPFHWRVEGTDVLSWQQGPFSPSQLLERLSTLGTLLDAAPSFLWQEPSRPGSAPDRGPGVPGSGS
jgi:hypothetical protein